MKHVPCKITFKMILWYIQAFEKRKSGLRASFQILIRKRQWLVYYYQQLDSRDRSALPLPRNPATVESRSDSKMTNDTTRGGRRVKCDRSFLAALYSSSAVQLLGESPPRAINQSQFTAGTHRIRIDFRWNIIPVNIPRPQSEFAGERARERTNERTSERANDLQRASPLLPAHLSGKTFITVKTVRYNRAFRSPRLNINDQRDHCRAHTRARY